MARPARTPWTAHHLLQPFVRWRRAGVWDRRMGAISATHDGNVQMIDGTSPNIPPRSNRRWKPCFSKRLYREHNLIERFFSKLKHFRRVATRYDKLAANFLAMVQLASLRLWLRAYESTANRTMAARTGRWFCCHWRRQPNTSDIRHRANS